MIKYLENCGPKKFANVAPVIGALGQGLILQIFCVHMFLSMFLQKVDFTNGRHLENFECQDQVF